MVSKVFRSKKERENRIQRIGVDRLDKNCSFHRKVTAQSYIFSIVTFGLPRPN